jgi:hypothetical protein
MSTPQSMSITQALAELKLLEKRLEKASNLSGWVLLSTKAQPVDEAKLRQKGTSEYQSYMDLLSRRNRIKHAIVMSNANTLVKIGAGETAFKGTVAEAIEYKASLKHQQKLLDGMKEMLLQARMEYDEHKRNADTRLERLLASELGKDVRTNPETIAALTASFNETNKAELVDPLNLAKKIEDLEEVIENFQTNVDWVLSETNGKTMISV